MTRYKPSLMAWRDPVDRYDACACGALKWKTHSSCRKCNYLPRRRELYLVERDRISHEMTRAERTVPDSGLRPTPRRPVIQQTVHQGTTYYAISAHELLEHEDSGHRARPGHPLG